ncbi:uncharacterized protein LOC111635416 isoform X1 [Centruroides sculpturatus]|uniref:uncharacterized protein LOC111635416 isoform X1 n=1 Tax=Centruroides sculpturatus TaxID=218467 RepID=UPI000C6DEFF4|nr:uncharacterized protein LOC111635416 isoform X1 [Centruroides sculpturatus]
MCVRIDSCCCFSNVKDGTLATGVYTSITSLLSSVACAVILAYSDVESYVRRPFLTAQVNRTATFTVAGIDAHSLRVCLAILLAWGAVCFLTSLILLYGVKRDHRYCLIPWMIWNAVAVVGQIALFVSSMAAVKANVASVARMVIAGFSVVFHLYCYSCVYSHYAILAESHGGIAYYMAKL